MEPQWAEDEDEAAGGEAEDGGDEDGGDAGGVEEAREVIMDIE